MPLSLKNSTQIWETNQKILLQKHGLTGGAEVDAYRAQFNQLIEEGLVFVESINVIPRYYLKGRDEFSPAKLWNELEHDIAMKKEVI